MIEDQSASEPLVTFYRFVPEARAPQRADRSAAGTMPARAFRYCEALRLASGFGWYLFPPLEFSLMWDGSEMLWTWAGEPSWYPLKSAQYPDFSDIFDKSAPDDVKGFSPPFLGALIEPGIVQIWSGFVARTRPGWSLLVRPCPNLPRSQNWEAYEGIIETDRWFGPVFINLRLTKTDVPIQFTPEFPLFQAQAIPRSVYAEEALGAIRVVGSLDDMSESDWDAYRRTVVKPNTDPDRRRGQYATDTRKRERDSEHGFVPHAQDPKVEE